MCFSCKLKTWIYKIKKRRVFNGDTVYKFKMTDQFYSRNNDGRRYFEINYFSKLQM